MFDNSICIDGFKHIHRVRHTEQWVYFNMSAIRPPREKYFNGKNFCD